MGTEQSRQAREAGQAAPVVAGPSPAVQQSRGNEAAQSRLASRRDDAESRRNRSAQALGEGGEEAGAFERYRSGHKRALRFLGQDVEVAEAMIAPMQSAEVRIQQTASTDPAHGIRQAGAWQPRNAGLHTWGLAVDLNYSNNPYVMHEAGEGTQRNGPLEEGSLDAQLAPVYHRIAGLMLGRESVVPRQMLGSRAGERAMALYDQLAEESRAMQEYFRLLENGTADGMADVSPVEPGFEAPQVGDGVRLPAEAPAQRRVRPGEAVRMDPLERWLGQHPTYAAAWSAVAGTAPLQPGHSAVDRVRRQMAADWGVLTARRAQPGAHAQNGDPIVGAAAPRPGRTPRADRPFDNSGGNEPGAQRDPRRGMMDLRREVVESMMRAGFQWGGASWEGGNGDLMHFQLPEDHDAVRAVQQAERQARTGGGSGSGAGGGAAGGGS